jgi:peptidylprolyl isomerase
VRRLALAALGTGGGETKDVLPVLWRGTRDVSASARAAAIGALAALLPPAEAFALLEEKARDRDPIVRAGAAEAAKALAAERAVSLLTPLIQDEELFVAGAAIRALGSFAVPARELLLGCLTNEDNGLALEAVLALRDSTQAGDLEHLVFALEGALDSRADISTELAFSLLENLGRVGNEAAREAVAKALAHRSPYVRSVARRVLAEHFPDSPLPELELAPAGLEPGPALDERLFEGKNPVAEVATSRGTLVFELFPAEAPHHVQSFMALAREKYYDGLPFHRVVPDFVVQGGDYRGDGNGGERAGGGTLRQEFSTRKSVRGTLGMPRNDDPDSGGSQIFVTHRPTPHLDGRYTYFGELRTGVDVLDRIEVGDRIVSVRIRR